jgi:hypothetical protein
MLKDFHFIPWFIENILWIILSFAFTVIFIKFFPSVIKAVLLSKKILHNNRNTRDNGWGKYSADRFLDIWFSSQKLPLRYVEGQFYYKKWDNLNSRHWMDVIDREFVEFQLIKIERNQGGYQVVLPIRNFRNNLIAKFTKWYLIKFIGDNPRYYRNMEEEARKNDNT